jgi:chaperonin GroES
MRATKNYFFITADMEAGATTGIKGHNGKDLILDKTMGSAKYTYATQHGVIDSVPGRVDKNFRYDIDLKPGEKVYFHHFVVRDKNKYEIEGRTLFASNYFNLWCVIRDGKIVMLEDMLLFEKILEPEENMFMGDFQVKSRRDFIPNMGRVTHVSKQVSEAGINPGDVILHVKDADYDINIEGNKYFKTQINSIICVQKNGGLEPQSDQLLVVPVKQTEIRLNLLLVKTQRESQLKGVVLKVGSDVKNVKVGDEIIYFNGLNSEVNYDGEEYSVIKEEYIVGVLEDHLTPAQA